MAPHQHLSKRAHITVDGTGGIVLIVLLSLAAVFCIAAVLLICKRKRARRQRQRKLAAGQESQPFVTQEPRSFATQEFRPLVADEHRMPEHHVEMGAEARKPIELQGGVVNDPSTRQPQQLDGFVAPATAAYDGRPVEMAAQSSAR